MSDRELTQEEIDLAPDCCDRYFISTDNHAVFFNESDFIMRSYGWHLDGQTLLGGSEFHKLSKPIPRKKIDITEYEFSDSEIAQAWCVDGQIQLNMVDGSRPALLNEDDLDVMKAHLVALRGGSHE